VSFQSSELEDFPKLDCSMCSGLTPSVRASLERILESQNASAISARGSLRSGERRWRRPAWLAGCCKPSASRTVRQTRNLCRQSQHQFHQHLFRGLQVLRLQPRPAANLTLISCSPNKSRKKPSKRGNSAPPRFAFRADCRTACLLFTIATFCAQ